MAEIADLSEKLANKHNEMIIAIDALKKQQTDTLMAHQVLLADLKKKHSLEITEKLTQLELQRKNNESSTKQLNA